MTEQGYVVSIQRHSIHDGAGIRTVVFLQGCPLRCAWCANPESASPGPALLYVESRCIHCGRCKTACSTQALPPDGRRENCLACGRCASVCPTTALRLSSARMTVDEVLHEVLQDEIYYRHGGGMTLSGGEPFYQPEFAAALLKGAKEQCLSTWVETCGCFAWDACEAAVRNTDAFYFDVKCADSELHRRFTGSGNRVILENLKKLLEAGKQVEVRIPMIGGYNVSEDNWRRTADLLRQIGYTGKIHLLPYHRLGRDKYRWLGLTYQAEDAQIPTSQQKETARRCFEQAGWEVLQYG